MSSRTDSALSVPTDSPDPYDKLGDALQQYYTRQEWLWLSDAEKARLEQTETEPEW